MSFRFKYWWPVMLWMAVIFSMSTQVGSPQHSLGLVESVLRWFMPHVSWRTIERIHLIARKVGHVFEFSVFAMLIWYAVAQPPNLKWRTWNWRPALVALVLSVIYASADEFHQVFVPTRMPSVHDVLIDACGACLGLFLIWSSSVSPELLREKAESVAAKE